MSTRNIIRAWRNPAYRSTLSAAEKAALPAHPAGSIEIPAEDLGQIAGGRKPQKTDIICTWITCTDVMCTLAANCTRNLYCI